MRIKLDTPEAHTTESSINVACYFSTQGDSSHEFLWDGAWVKGEKGKGR